MLKRDGYEVTIAADGEQALAELAKTAGRRRHHRPRHAPPRRHGPPAAGLRRLPGRAGHHHHRPRHGRHRRRGHQGRGLRLRHQALRAGGAPQGRRQGGPGPRPGAAERPRGTRRGRTAPPLIGAVARHEDHLRHDRQGRRHALHRAHHRRERHRQGAHRHGAPPTARAAATSRSSRSTAPPSPRTSWSPSSSATRRAPSPARSGPSRGASSSPTAARSSSTRSARSPSRCRSSSCASSRSRSSSASAASRP